MNFSERAMLAIVKIQEETRMNFFEATAEFCNVSDIDPIDFARKVDKVVLERLQCCALEERMLQQKYVNAYTLN